jgi:hypothetical protein
MVYPWYFFFKANASITSIENHGGVYMSQATAYVSGKLAAGGLSSEDLEALSQERARLQEEEEVRKSLQKLPKSKNTHFPAGMLLNVPFGSEVLLPKGYVLTTDGVYRYSFDEEEGINLDSWLHLCRTPFFIASRNKTHIQLLYKVNKEWLRGWFRPSEVKPATLFNMFILPEKKSLQKELMEYTHRCMISAPFSPGDDSIEDVVKEIFRQFSASTYPALFRVSEIVRICSDLGVKYEEVRKWLEARGYINHGPGTVKRAPDPHSPGITKAQRFLVMQKPFKQIEH